MPWARHPTMAQRYFVDQLPTAGEFTLGEAVAHHLATVMRTRPGAEIRLGDGRGATAEAEVLMAGRRELRLRILRHELAPPPAQVIHVAFAPPRLNRAEWLFEHGTEVGIGVFHPLWTQRSRPQGERPERWLKLVTAAAGQCDRAWLPAIEPARDLAEFLARPDLPARRLLGAGGAPAIRPDPAAAATILLVGPEGGFEADEAAAALAAGFVPAGLGPHTLRTETAALVGAALLLATR